MTDTPTAPAASAAPSSEATEPAPGGRLSRRSFLAGSAAVGAAVVVGGVGGVALASVAMPAKATAAGPVPGYLPFDGIHQAGIVNPLRPQAAALFVALDAVVSSKAELVTALAELTRRSRNLSAGMAPEAGDTLYPPPESGIVGATVGPSDLTITWGFGASLFDERFGLADQRPVQLTRMPQFPNDRLQPSLTHGDLLLQICAADETSCIHALRYLMLGTRGSLVVRWLIHGFQQRPGGVDGAMAAGSVPATRRNLLGFKDGTANPPVAESSVADELVWVNGAQGEPAWTVGGSYMVVRTIRMFVERWDRTALGEQEAIIGRTKRTGAPLGKAREDDDPDYPGDPDGGRIPMDAHIRMANPRTPGTEGNRILRRGYSYSRGFDGAGLLDQGLFFVGFQRDLERGFVTVQKRLAGEPLEEYIQPVGGGYFFAPPGTRGPDDVIGGSLFA
jgi:deferrochelatase/peroxidase EfeB